MAKLPALAGRDVVKALHKAGLEVVGRPSSHIRMKGMVGGGLRSVIVADHDEIQRGAQAYHVGERTGRLLAGRVTGV